jgi:hypothetical protein
LKVDIAFLPVKLTGERHHGRNVLPCRPINPS